MNGADDHHLPLNGQVLLIKCFFNNCCENEYDLRPIHIVLLGFDDEMLHAW